MTNKKHSRHCRYQVPPAVQREFQMLGERIKINRKYRKWTLQDMANKCGCSVPTLRDLEKGKSTVSIYVLMHVLWCLQKHKDISNVCEKPYVELAKDDPFKGLIERL